MNKGRQITNLVIPRIVQQRLADRLDGIRRRLVTGEIDEATADWELIQMGYSQLYRQDKLRGWKAGME